MKVIAYLPLQNTYNATICSPNLSTFTPVRTGCTKRIQGEIIKLLELQNVRSVYIAVLLHGRDGSFKGKRNEDFGDVRVAVPVTGQVPHEEGSRIDDLEVGRLHVHLAVVFFVEVVGQQDHGVVLIMIWRPPVLDKNGEVSGVIFLLDAKHHVACCWIHV